MDDSEKRIDPVDGVAYTFEALSVYFSGKYKKGVIAAYWAECMPIKKSRRKGCTKEVEDSMLVTPAVPAANKYPASAAASPLVPFQKQPLPVQDLCVLGVPLRLDTNRYSDVVSACYRSDASGTCYPNRLLRLGDLHWAQDTSFDSFSKGESLWATLMNVVSGTMAISRVRGSKDSWLPTLRVAQHARVWYSVDTRRLLIYKIAFHADHLIPVFGI